MKKFELDKLKALLRKYKAGQSSLEEEQVLRTYFQRADVPEELSPYQAEFGYYTHLQSLHMPSLPAQWGADSSLPSAPNLLSVPLHIIAIAIGAAGLILAVILLFPFLSAPIDHPEPEGPPLTIPDTIPSFETFPDSTVSDSQSSSSLLLPTNPTPISPTSPVQIQLPKDSAKKQAEVLDEKVVKIPSDSNKSLSSSFPVGTVRTDTPPSAIQSLTETRFSITEITPSETLQKIAYLADKAGIEYTYVVDRHRKNIHELNIVMVVRESGVKTQKWITVPKKKGRFSISMPALFYVGFLLFACWTFVWLGIHKRPWQYRWSVDEIDQLFLAVAVCLGVSHFLFILEGHLEPSSSSQDPKLGDRMMGPYWFAFWMYPLTYLSLFLLFKIKTLRQSVLIRILTGLWLLFLLHVNSLIIFLTSWHRDYVSGM